MWPDISSVNKKISSFPNITKVRSFTTIIYLIIRDLLKSKLPENISLNPDLLILKLIMENIEDHSEELWWKICHV